MRFLRGPDDFPLLTVKWAGRWRWGEVNGGVKAWDRGTEGNGWQAGRGAFVTLRALAEGGQRSHERPVVGPGHPCC